MPSIDLNADLGEHSDSTLDEQIMPFLSSCSIACGGHAGNEQSMRNAVRSAKRNGVAIGAHPAYPDRENFGRESMDISLDELKASLEDQIRWLLQICIEEQVRLFHVKPHGALYNDAAKDLELSNLIASVVADVDPGIKLFGLAHSVSEQAAHNHALTFVPEAFADRRYESDKRLQSRKIHGAVISDLSEVLQQVEELAINNRVWAHDWLTIHAKSICLHGDTEGSVTLAKRINEHLVNKGVDIAAV